MHGTDEQTDRQSLRLMPHLGDVSILTSGQTNLTSEGHIAAAHGPFNCIRQVAPLCTPYTESQKWLPWQRPSASLDSHLTHDSLGPSEPTIKTASRSVQSFFAGLTNVTDQPTDHATRSVTIGCINVRSTAMRPNNAHTRTTQYVRAAITRSYADIDHTPLQCLDRCHICDKVASVTVRVARCVMARRTVARLVFGIERCSILCDFDDARCTTKSQV